jgi:putative Mg2+ transporter-C (MgtC) family protein
MIFDFEIVLRLFVAAVLGGLVGFERERHHQPAGLRTHMILAIGSALAMCISIDLAMQYRQYAPNGDPARLAAQVISGIGFLGAGAILRYGTSVKGLTTATSLWTVAIIGLAVGAGHYLPAIAASVLLLLILSVLDIMEKRLIVVEETRALILKAVDRPYFTDDLRKVFGEFGIVLKSFCVSKDIAAREIELEAVVKMPEKADLEQLIGTLSKMEGAKSVEIQ